MGGATVQIESKIVDGNPELARLDTVSVRLPQMRITVADLIRRTVEEQVWDLISRKKVDAEEARRALERHYFTQDQVEALARKGAVRYPSKAVRTPRVDTEEEVQRAIRAFENGAFMIIVNGRQVESLGEEVSFAETGRVTFLRLTPLAGG